MKIRSLLPLYLLVVFGFVLSLASLQTHVNLSYGLDTFSICSISKDFSCRAVIGSKYGYFLGISTSHWGMAYYAFLFFLIAFSVRRNNSSLNLVHYLSIFSVVFSIILFLISKFILRSICPICLILYVVNILILLSLYFFRHRKAIKFKYGFFEVVNEVKFACRAKRYIFRFILAAIISWVVPFLSEQVLINQAYDKKIANLKLPWEKKYNLTGIDANAYYVLGKKSAPVKIVEYADFECAPCRKVSSILHKLIAEYPEKIVLVYKNFPWNASCNSNTTHTMHELACDAVVYSLCGGSQGKYWDINKRIMELDWSSNLDSEDLEDRFKQISSDLNLNKEQIEFCKKTRQYEPILSAQIADARRLKIAGTPTIFINGRRVIQPDEFSLRAIIENIINEN